MISDEHAISLIEALERKGFKIDAILPSGTHRYRSTHCRHFDHGECSTARGYDAEGEFFARRPAQCKACAAPCVCPDCDHPRS